MAVADLRRRTFWKGDARPGIAEGMPQWEPGSLAASTAGGIQFGRRDCSQADDPADGFALDVNRRFPPGPKGPGLPAAVDENGGRVYVNFSPALLRSTPMAEVVAAIKFGRAIRALNANTLQIRSAQCVSACALAFLGGVKRSAEPGAIGVHQAFFSDDAGLDNKAAVATIQMLTGEVIGYLSDMGVSAKLLLLSLSIESSDMRYLTTAEMREWNIITEDRGPGTQTGFETAVAAPASPASAPQLKTEAAKPSPPSGPLHLSGDTMRHGLRQTLLRWHSCRKPTGTKSCSMVN